MQCLCQVAPEFGLMQIQQAAKLCSNARGFADT